jgi:hypothetical protein
VIELGTDDQVLSSTGRNLWDIQTLRAVSETHGVDAVVMGRFDMEQDKPGFALSTVWKTLSVKSDVDAMLSAKLVETQTGATMWTDSAKATVNVANAQFNIHGEGHLGATDPEAVFGDMIGSLVEEITEDFRVHYITRRVPKEQLQTASAAE